MVSQLIFETYFSDPNTYGLLQLIANSTRGPWWCSGNAPASEVGSSNPGPYVVKLVVVYQWSAAYSTEP